MKTSDALTMNLLKKLFLLVALLPGLALAETALPLDRAPINLTNQASLQRGARTFVNYCLSCHSAQYMRYSRLEALGLTEDQIKQNLLFTRKRVGDTMTVAMRPDDAKKWFGVAPPDLTVITRALGPNFVYTYLRSFYRDPTRPTGWNNVAFPNVAMPNVLANLQGDQVAVFKTHVDTVDGKPEKVETFAHFDLVKNGSMTPAQYNAMVGDLVNYLTWMGEPAKEQRLHTGVYVMIFLFVFLVFAYFLKKEYWKDVH